MSELCRRANDAREPADALRAVTTLRSRLEGLERDHVAALLARGATWADIAAELGISRQAAHRRFRTLHQPSRNRQARAAISGVLVTGDARGTVRMARQEAEALGAGAVGTEHLLLALTRGAAGRLAEALRAAGVDEHRLRATLQPTVVGGGADAAPCRAGFTPNARDVLEGSLREAVRRGEGYIGSDHLLLALLRNPGGGAAQTLGAIGVDPQALFAKLAAGATG